MDHHERSQLYDLFDLENVEDVHDGAGFFIYHWSRRVYLLPSSPHFRSNIVLLQQSWLFCFYSQLLIIHKHSLCINLFFSFMKTFPCSMLYGCGSSGTASRALLGSKRNTAKKYGKAESVLMRWVRPPSLHLPGVSPLFITLLPPLYNLSSVSCLLCFSLLLLPYYCLSILWCILFFLVLSCKGSQTLLTSLLERLLLVQAFIWAI